MKINAFEKIIRKVVREEIDHALRREIALLKEELVTQPTQQRVVETTNNTQEVEDFRAKLKSQMPPPNFNGSGNNNALNSLLNETAMSPTPEQMFNTNDPVSQFVNKDWSPVMKAIEKKKEFRP